MTVYSYSAIKSYSTCPRQYHHRYVLKDLPPVDWDTPALRKGREVHEALERAVLEGNDAPELGPHTFWTPPALLSKLHKAGARAEVRMAIREDDSPYDFFAKDARFRGVIEDRKSTRLNSSHVAISYAVFCLKKKNNNLQ